MCAPQAVAGWPGEPQHGQGLGPLRARRASWNRPARRGAPMKKVVWAAGRRGAGAPPSRRTC